MNDAERDAWLREALRHAPDFDALPPSGVSEAILLKARAAARGSRHAHATPLTAIWDWLARPPVAAGFASVMAATLVGLMWWDRPMDEAMPRPPALASARAPAAPSLASASAPPAATPQLASTSPAPAETPPATVPDATQSTPDPRPMNEATNNAAVADGAARLRQRSAPEQTGAADAKRADRAAAPAPRSVDLLAKEQALPIEKKNEAPAPFPSTEMQREAASARKSLDAAAANEARKKDVEASRSRAADELERSAAPAENAVAAKAKSVAATLPASATPADAPRFQQPQGALGGMREQEAAGLASSPPVPSAAPAPFRSESQRSGPDALLRADPSARAVAPARVLAAIAAEPGLWLRQTAGGDTVALDPGWRAWLAELDAAAAGRWQPLGATGPPSDDAAARDGSTTLRLVNAGRVVAIIRLDGTRVQVDAAPGTGADRWQATLVPAGAEHLRSTARRLSP
jgi:hypothetical protein